MTLATFTAAGAIGEAMTMIMSLLGESVQVVEWLASTFPYCLGFYGAIFSMVIGLVLRSKKIIH